MACKQEVLCHALSSCFSFLSNNHGACHYLATKASVLNCSTICLARIPLRVTNRISAHPVDTSLLHQAQRRALIQRWLEYVGFALRDKLYGLRFHAVTKTCAPFARTSCVKEIKTMPNASSVTDPWSVGLPFTNLKKMILTIRSPLKVIEASTQTWYFRKVVISVSFVRCGHQVFLGS